MTAVRVWIPLRMLMVACTLVCLVSAWHPEKKVVKWGPSFFRPSPHIRMCGSLGSPCGLAQRHYGLFWRSTSCCYGLECADAGHGSFCSVPRDDSSESMEDEENRIPDDSDLAESLRVEQEEE